MARARISVVGGLVVLTMATSALMACGPNPAKKGQPTSAAAVPTTSLDVGEHACAYITDAEARIALGAEVRRNASTTAAAHTFCTFRTDDPDSDLIVTAGGGGTASYIEVIEFTESDLNAGRKGVAGLPGAYIISGNQLSRPVVVVGVLRGQHWFTAALRATGVSRSTLEERSMALLNAGVARLET